MYASTSVSISVAIPTFPSSVCWESLGAVPPRCQGSVTNIWCADFSPLSYFAFLSDLLLTTSKQRS